MLSNVKTKLKCTSSKCVCGNMPEKLCFLGYWVIELAVIYKAKFQEFRINEIYLCLYPWNLEYNHKVSLN